MTCRTRWAVAVALLVASAACSSAPDGEATDPSPSSHATSTTAVPARRSTVPATTTVPDAEAARSAGCGRPRRVRTGTSDHTIRSRGVDRSYQLVVPTTYDGRTPFAVVLGLHALTVDYRVIPSMTDFDGQQQRYDFIGVAPSGRRAGGPAGTPFWNAAPYDGNYDVAFLRALLDRLERTLCIDPRKVFSTGMSNGAQMSSLLACRLDDRIAAIAPVAGVEYLAPCRGRPVPVIAFHGTEDPVLPYAGGGLNATTIAGLYFFEGGPPDDLPAPLGVDESMQRWAEHNGCDPHAREQRLSPEVVRRRWSGCAAPTVLYAVEGGGHTWPGQAGSPQFGASTDDIDATRLMFSFFFGA